MAGASVALSDTGLLFFVTGSSVYSGRIQPTGEISPIELKRTLTGMDHANAGNNAAALLNNNLIVVDHENSHVLKVDDQGQVAADAISFSNPQYLGQHYVYTNRGKVYVTATNGKIYRLDGLPSEPSLAIRVSQVELSWSSLAGAECV